MNMEKPIKRRHRKYDAQFKEGALKQIEHGQSVSSVARALGISEALLYQWRQRRQSAGSHGSSDQVKELLKQVKRLELGHFKKRFDPLQSSELKTIYTQLKKSKRASINSPAKSLPSKSFAATWDCPWKP